MRRHVDIGRGARDSGTRAVVVGTWVRARAVTVTGAGVGAGAGAGLDVGGIVRVGAGCIRRPGGGRRRGGGVVVSMASTGRSIVVADAEDIGAGGGGWQGESGRRCSPARSHSRNGRRARRGEEEAREQTHGGRGGQGGVRRALGRVAVVEAQANGKGGGGGGGEEGMGRTRRGGCRQTAGSQQAHAGGAVGPAARGGGLKRRVATAGTCGEGLGTGRVVTGGRRRQCPLVPGRQAARRRPGRAAQDPHGDREPRAAAPITPPSRVRSPAETCFNAGRGGQRGLARGGARGPSETLTCPVETERAARCLADPRSPRRSPRSPHWRPHAPPGPEPGKSRGQLPPRRSGQLVPHPPSKRRHTPPAADEQPAEPQPPAVRAVGMPRCLVPTPCRRPRALGISSPALTLHQCPPPGPSCTRVAACRLP